MKTTKEQLIKEIIKRTEGVIYSETFLRQESIKTLKEILKAV